MVTLDALRNLADSIKMLIEEIDSDTRVMPYGEAAFVLNKSNRTIFRYIDQGKLHKASGNGVVGVRAKEVYEMVINNPS